MKIFKQSLKFLALPVLLLTIPALLLPHYVQAEDGNLLHSESISKFHEWDDGLSEWQNGRRSFYSLKTETDQSGFISDGRYAVTYDKVYLEEAALSAGEQLTLSGTFAFFPTVSEDWAYMSLAFYAQNDAELASYSSEMITSTRESGPVYRKVSEVIPKNTAYLVCSFYMNKAGEADHFYFRDINLQIGDGGSTEAAAGTAAEPEPAETTESTGTADTEEQAAPEAAAVPEETTVPEEAAVPEETAVPEEAAVPEETAVAEEPAETAESSATEEPASSGNSAGTVEAGGPVERNGIDVVGDAFFNDQGYYVLTKEEENQAGAVWIKNPQKADNFTVSFDYYTGSGKISGADGITLVFYADRSSVADDRNYLITQDSIGYGVEVDTYYNEVLQDIQENHFAILDGYVGNHLNYADAVSYSEDGQFHHMKVVVENGTCFVYVDGLLRLGKTDIIPTGSYDIGITGRTGGLFNVQVVKDIEVTWSVPEDALNSAENAPSDVVPASTSEQTQPSGSEDAAPAAPAEDQTAPAENETVPAEDQTAPDGNESQNARENRSPDTFSTEEAATLSDTQRISYVLLRGEAPSGVEKLEDFSEVTGGWKGYIIVDPEGEYDSVMEMFLNVQIDGTAEETAMILDWSYIYLGSSGEGQEDGTPDTGFYGSWADGVLNAEGPGSVTLTDFYYDAGYEYAIGSLTTRNGVPASIVLFRP